MNRCCDASSLSSLCRQRSSVGSVHCQFTPDDTAIGESSIPVAARAGTVSTPGLRALFAVAHVCLADRNEVKQ